MLRALCSRCRCAAAILGTGDHVLERVTRGFGDLDAELGMLQRKPVDLLPCRAKIAGQLRADLVLNE